MSDMHLRANSLILRLKKWVDIPDDIMEKMGSVITMCGGYPITEEEGCKFYIQNFALVRSILLKYSEYFFPENGGMSKVFFVEKDAEWLDEIHVASGTPNYEYFGVYRMKWTNRWNEKCLVPMSMKVINEAFNYDIEEPNVYIWDKSLNRQNSNYVVRKSDLTSKTLTKLKN